MSPPENPDHGDAAEKCRHIPERTQQRRDIIGHLLGRDDQHGDGKSKCGIDEGFQPRHLQPAQTKPFQPRQRIQLCRQCRRNLLVPFVHAPPVMPHVRLQWQSSSPFASRNPRRRFLAIQNFIETTDKPRRIYSSLTLLLPASPNPSPPVVRGGKTASFTRASWRSW